MYHLLNDCTHKEIINARKAAVFNLGERLSQMGPPNWWKLPAPLSHSPSPHTFATPPSSSSATTIWKTLTEQTDPDLPPITSIPIPRSNNTPTLLGANYLHTWLFSASRSTLPTSPHDLPLVTNRQTGSHILHPAIIEAATLTYSINAELLATPPYLSHHLQQHYTAHQHPDFPTLLQTPLKNAIRGIGTLAGTDPLLPHVIRNSATAPANSTILLLIRGPLPKHITQLL